MPKQIKTESVDKEEQVTKNLYRDYSAFKRALFADLCERNTQYDRLTLFKKSQKLLDRLLFIFFAEDKHLLPANSIVKIIAQWEQLKELDAYIPLYDRYKKYFCYLNTGYKGKTEEIFAYNGGLFAPDDVLDSVSIDDEILRWHTTKIADYDFASEVDVNILGHIFENSLTEIEEITTEITMGEKPTSKRKKDGVFYTPRYITTYIVDNTLGKLCREKRVEMGIVEQEYFADKKRQTATKKRLDDNLTQYREWLLGLTICDPACGSGAFLNAALDFLMAEHRLIDEMAAKLLGYSMVFPDVETVILERNLYGVDINDESIEIAKLALWLRTAQPHRKLTTLNNNIKCGNSLISDVAVAGDKAFDWAAEFPQVFAKGGFDVVIGNPPYIKEYTNKKAFEGLHTNPCYQGKMDLWYFFGWLGLEIVKSEIGLIGYIAPNNWVTNAGASVFRNIVLDRGLILEFVDFGDFKVFDAAGIQTMIYIMKKTSDNHNYKVPYSKILDSSITHNEAALFLKKDIDKRFIYFNSEIDKERFKDKFILFINNSVNDILDKIQINNVIYLQKDEVANGIDVHQDFVNARSKEILGHDFEVGDGIFNISNNELQNLNLTEKEKELVKPFYTTNQLGRYITNSQNELWVIYTDSSFKNEAAILPYPNLKIHLDKFKDVITSDNKPYGLHRSREESFFKGEKIVSLRKAVTPAFTYTDFDTYISQSFYIIKTDKLNLKTLTTILNSSLIRFWLKHKGKMQGDIFQIDKEPLLNIPIAVPDNQQPYIELADKMLELNRLLAEKRAAFITLLSNNVDGVKITKALEGFDSLDFKGLLAELKKQKISIPLASQSEWQQAFDQHRTACIALATEIASTDRTIDQMVYALYNLTPEEIAIIKK